jgi:release factor glutamine methyltransferase
MQEKKINTLLEILSYSTDLLKNKGIQDARLNIELMLCDVLNCERIKLYLDYDKPLKQTEIDKYKSYLKRRLNKEPLQYILGKTNFYGYDIYVDKSVLIPRQDTEVLVEKTLEDIEKSGLDFINILEIGTGSGCISIALSEELSKKNIKHKIEAIDISENALRLAKKNLEFHNISGKLELKCEDFFKKENLNDSINYIISNPPYISNDEMLKLDDEIREFEPVIALTDFGDGFKFYEKLFKLISGANENIRVFLEIGYIHSAKLDSMLKKYGINKFEFYKDYNNINRVLKIN